MAPDPILAYPRPDVEALVFATAKPFGGVVTWAYAAQESGGLPGWLTATSVQVDVRAGSREAARARADEIRRAVCALPFAPWDEGVVARVNVTEGPFWFPDPDGAPRYVARYEVLAHPLPAQPRR
jgi:hypothetical protein